MRHAVGRVEGFVLDRALASSSSLLLLLLLLLQQQLLLRLASYM